MVVVAVVVVVVVAVVVVVSRVGLSPLLECGQQFWWVVVQVVQFWWVGWV